MRTCAGTLVRRAAWGVLAALMLAACSSGPELSVRYRDTGLNDAFRYGGMTYPEYVAHMRRVIGQTRRDLTPERRDQIIDWNSPFVLEPDSANCRPAAGGRFARGVLLIHGLSDSPYNMRDLAEHLRRQCFVAYGLLLPGHGTVPGDLLNVTYQEWVKATRYGIAALRPRVEQLFVAGFSTGGALALDAALSGEPIDGLMLFAPALGLHSELVALAGTLDAVAGTNSARHWIDVAPDEDPAKYESFPLNAASQIFELTKVLEQKRKSERLSVPVFAAFSEDDMTVDSKVTIEYFSQATDRRSRILIYTRSPDERGSPNTIRIAAARPAENILNFAHLSLTNAPSNPHYGRTGDYVNCLHYLDKQKPDNKSNWERCKRDPVPAGEINPENLRGQVMRRLTYNPDFPNMLRQLDAFTASVVPTPAGPGR